MDGLNYLVILCCFAFVCSIGRGFQVASCEVGIMVRKGTTWQTAPKQSLTVSCPVTHCGQTLNVTWCKLNQLNRCEQLNKTDNVEIRQTHNQDKDKLESYLSFRQISVYDDGLYKCKFVGDSDELESGHFINISVSDSYLGAKKSEFEAVKGPSAPGDDAASWLPYFCITMSIVLLVVTLTVLTLLRFYGWKRILTFNHTKGEEMPTHIIPGIPKWSSSSSPGLQGHFFHVNDIYSPTSPETPRSPPALSPTGDWPTVSKTADKSQASGSAVYAVINHKRPRVGPRKQNAATKEDKNPQYAVIKVP